MHDSLSRRIPSSACAKDPSAASRRESCSSMASTIRRCSALGASGILWALTCTPLTAGKVVPVDSAASSPADARIAYSRYFVSIPASGCSAARPRPIAQSTGARLVGPTGARMDSNTSPSFARFFGAVVHLATVGYMSPNSAFPWKNGVPRATVLYEEPGGDCPCTTTATSSKRATTQPSGRLVTPQAAASGHPAAHRGGRPAPAQLCRCRRVRRTVSAGSPPR
jgi:hypothetical protein